MCKAARNKTLVCSGLHRSTTGFCCISCNITQIGIFIKIMLCCQLSSAHHNSDFSKIILIQNNQSVRASVFFLLHIIDHILDFIRKIRERKIEVNFSITFADIIWDVTMLMARIKKILGLYTVRLCFSFILI